MNNENGFKNVGGIYMRTIKINDQDGCYWLYGKNNIWKEYCGVENFDNTFVIHGNRDYENIEEADWFDTVKYLMKDFDESDLDDEEDAKLLRENYTEYSDEQWKSIVEIYQNCKYSDSDDTYLRVLKILYPNDKWEIGTIRGYTQGEWNTVLYKANNVQNLDTLESYYFGQLAEIYDEEENCTAIITHDELWKAEREKKLSELIKDRLGLSADEEIEVYISDGYIQQTNWKSIEV